MEGRMPEPIVTETGFVPGDGVESSTDVLTENVSPVIQQGRDVVGDLFARIGAPGFTEASPEDKEEESTTETQDTAEATSLQSTDQKREDSAPPKPDNGEEVVSLTRSELDRRIQAETDRRESVRRNRVEKAAKSVQNQQKLNRLREAGDFEGYVAEHQAQEIDDSAAQEEAQRLTAIHNQLTLTFDSAVLDPVVMMLPEKERDSLIEAINPIGIEGRSKVLTATVGRLLEIAKAEGAAKAEESLRKNAAFRKQVLLEARQREDEPDIIPSGGKTPAAPDMNNWVRSLIR